MNGTAPTAAVVLVAAGAGTRLGADVPKAFVQLAGRSILEHAIDGILGASRRFAIVIVVPETMLDRAREIVAGLPAGAAAEIKVVAGGDHRQDSVRAGLAALPQGVRTVLVHDAARALTPARLFDAVAAEVDRSGGGVIPVLAVADTLKRIAPDKLVSETVDRGDLAAVQTPQGFPRADIELAYAAATEQHTDDAGLFAANGGTVRTIEGDAAAFKITVVADLRRAEYYARGASVPELRTGVGIDVHAYDQAAPLWLGALYWPDLPGLAGHSDGDAVCHAICDALLSAAGLGDIGGRFGTDDPSLLDAHGDVFITEAVGLVTGAGWRIMNVAVQVVGEQPRIGPRRVELESRLGALVGAAVSVAGTTSDHLGFTGRGEGLTAVATALIAR